MRVAAYFLVCLAAIVILFWSAQPSYLNLFAALLLLLALLKAFKAHLVDQKKLKTLCDFYQRVHAFDELFLLKDERPYKKILEVVVQTGDFDWAVLFLMDFDKDSFIATESVGIKLECFSEIGFDQVDVSPDQGMEFSLKLLELAFKRYELRGALAGAAIEKNSVYYGCLLVGRHNDNDALTETDYLRLNMLSEQISISLHNYRLHNELTFRAEQLIESQKRLNKELKMAKLVQDNAIATEPPEFEGINSAIFVQPAREIGGDFLKFYNRSKNQLTILLGDVCGKGVPAALITSVVLCLFQEKIAVCSEPSDILLQVNRSLKKFLGTNSILNSTAAFGVIDVEQKLFRYASAGHDFPLLVKGENHEIIELESTGTLLGLYDDSDFFTRDVTINSGDKLVLYSDGLVDFFELEDPDCDGFKKLKDFLTQHKSNEPEIIVKQIKEMVENKNALLKDDITLAVLELI
ncbi:MAG: PP2C family protein-serine/threonine phosphatase [Candidatus Rifleibacteriota bacterium]